MPRIVKHSSHPNFSNMILRTWTALWTEVSQHNHRLLALLDGPALNSGDEVVFAVERACLACEAETLFACDLRDGSAGCQVALQDSMITVNLDPIISKCCTHTADVRSP